MHLQSTLLQLCISVSSRTFAENIPGTFRQDVFIATVLTAWNLDVLLKRHNLKTSSKNTVHSYCTPDATYAMFLSAIPPTDGRIWYSHIFLQLHYYLWRPRTTAVQWHALYGRTLHCGPHLIQHVSQCHGKIVPFSSLKWWLKPEFYSI